MKHQRVIVYKDVFLFFCHLLLFPGCIERAHEMYFLHLFELTIIIFLHFCFSKYQLPCHCPPDNRFTESGYARDVPSTDYSF